VFWKIKYDDDDDSFEQFHENSIDNTVGEDNQRFFRGSAKTTPGLFRVQLYTKVNSDLCTQKAQNVDFDFHDFVLQMHSGMEREAECAVPKIP